MSFYHDIFVSNDDFDIDCYKEYMFSNFVKNKFKKLEIEPIVEEKEVAEREIERYLTFPEMQDQLFWCVYIALNNSSYYKRHEKRFIEKDEYFRIKENVSQSTNIMMDIKADIVEYFSEDFKRMKNINVKLTNAVIQEIISELATNRVSTIKSLYAYAVYFDVRMFVVKDEFYLDLNPKNYDTKSVVLIIKKNKEYGVHYLASSYVDEIEKEYFKLETYENPLKPISKYTISELRDLAHYFDLKYDKKPDKQTLYRDLCKVCEW